MQFSERTVFIEGSYGEGGGQILRTSLALSALLSVPIYIRNIRVRRSKPGLQPQHLASVQLMQSVTGARVYGASLDSRELYFEPQGIRAGRYVVNVGTAGSVTLVLQTVIPALLFADGPSEVKVIGGTDVEHAPTVDYFEHVFLPWLREMGGDVRIRLERRGYFPKGGGVVVASVFPVRRLKPVVLTEMPEKVPIRGISHAGALPEHVAQRQASSAEKRLKDAGFDDVSIEVVSYSRSEVLCPGSGITLWGEGVAMGASSFGAKGVVAEVVGKRAANYMLHYLDSGRPVDPHMGDQLIPYMAVADGPSEIRVVEGTMHMVTNMWVVERILGVKFDVEREESGGVRVRVHGTGLENKHKD